MEQWFDRYPTTGQAELCARFRSDNNTQHQSAFFELFLHELLFRLGCHVTLHPDIPNISKTPDFLVESPNGERFYIEATITTCESATEAAARARMNAVYDVLNREIKSPDFSLWINIEGAPATPPPAKRIASFINAHLAKLDYDEITRLYESERTEEVPRWRFEHEGWKIEFKPYPKTAKARGKPGVRPICGHSWGFREIDHRKPIRNAITKKAGRYGDLDLPYVVAVNVLEFIDEIDIMEALFGQEQLTISFSQNGFVNPVDTQISQLPSGAWTEPSGSRYTGVSAVLLASWLQPSNVPRADLCLYHNPWALRPYKSVLTRLPQAVLRDNQMEYVDGESIEKIFALPELWPKDAG